MRGVSRNQGDEFVTGGGDLDIGGMGHALRRSRKWIIGATVMALLGSAAFVTLVKPRYTAEAKALIENQESYFTRPDRTGGDTAGLAPDPEAVTSQAQLVTSRDLSREVIKALKLKGNAEFDPTATSNPLGAVLKLLGLQSDGAEPAADERIFNNYSDRLNVFPVVKSRVLQIEFSSWDPELAARAANTIAELYIGVQSNAKRSNARIAAGSLATLIADLRTRVADAERKAEEFRASNSLLLVGANNLSMNSQQVSDLNTQLTVARTAQADSQAKSRMIREMLRQGRIGEVPDVANNELIRRLSEQRAILRGQIASEGRTLLQGHPRVKELNAQLAELENNIKIAADKTARTLENDARIAGSRVENLQAALNEQKKTVGGASVDEAHAKELDREARLLKDQLESSTTKYQEALARQAAESTPSDARIISRAVAPLLPTFPKKLPIIVFATLAAFILTAGMVLAAELMSGRAYALPANETVQQVEPKLDMQIDRPAAVDAAIAARPEANSLVASIATAESPSPGRDTSAGVVAREALVESLDGVADQISRWTRAGGAIRILVTGATHAAGAAHQAVELGRTLSRSRRAILVEFGGANGDNNGPLGLSDLLAGQADFEAVIHRDRGSPLHLMPIGRGGPVLAEGLDAVIEALAQTYDYLIVLAPPVAANSEALLIAPEVDFAVLVCGVQCSQHATGRAYEELRRAGAAKVIAVSVTPPDSPEESMHKQAA